MKTKITKCPKCGSTSLDFIELWENHTVDFSQNNEDRIVYPEFNMNPGNPYGVEAICCRCNHQWRLRGVIQITDLSNYIIVGEENKTGENR